MPTPKEVADWMTLQLEENEELPQQETAYAIREKFGEEFVCLDRNGDLGISRRVLYQFRKLTGDDVVWVYNQEDWLKGYWRFRDSGDREGRTQLFF